MAQGGDREPDRDRPPVARHARRDRYGLVLAGGLEPGRHQADAEPLTDRVAQEPRLLARGKLEERVHAAVQIEDGPLAVHDGRGRPEALRDGLHGGEGEARRRHARRVRRDRPAVRTPRRQLQAVGRARAPCAVNPPLPGHRLEEVLLGADALGRTQEQAAALAQREVEGPRDPPLRRRVQVDEQVAAAHEVEAGERRVGRQVVRGEDDGVAQVLRHVVPAGLACEEAAQECRRHARDVVFGIPSEPGRFHRVGVRIGREDLELDRATSGRDAVRQEHGQAVGLLARGARRDPRAQGRLRRRLAHEARDDRLVEHAPRFGLAEERGDADQQVLAQGGGLVPIRLEQPGIGRMPVEVQALDAASDPALERRRPVFVKVVSGGVAHCGEDRLQVGWRDGRARGLGILRAPGAPPASFHWESIHGATKTVKMTPV